MKKLPDQVSDSVKRLNPHLYGGFVGSLNSCPDTFPHNAGEVITPKPPRRIRQDTKPLMNKLETECYQRLCKMYDPVNVFPQSIRVKLGNGVWYKVDFMVFHPHGLEAFEVKGPHAFRGGLENLKIAASKYPSITWWLTWKDKEQGTWCDQQLKP